MSAIEPNHIEKTSRHHLESTPIKFALIPSLSSVLPLAPGFQAFQLPPLFFYPRRSPERTNLCSHELTQGMRSCFVQLWYNQVVVFKETDGGRGTAQGSARSFTCYKLEAEKGQFMVIRVHNAVVPENISGIYRDRESKWRYNEPVQIRQCKSQTENVPLRSI